jgi:hypothetical protein
MRRRGKVSERTLSRAEYLHVKEALEDYRDLLRGYPEVTTQRKEDNLKIALEILTNENPLD